MRAAHLRRMLVTLLTVGFAVWAGIALSLFLFQSRLVYFPARGLAATPADVGLAYEDVRVETADGVALHGWWIPAGAHAPAIAFFHGNAGNVSHRLDTFALFRRLGFATLAIDYRGYGESEGEPDEAGTYADARAAWAHLTGTLGVDRARVVVHGRSLGGAVAARLAAEVNPAGLVLESTFTSVPDLAAELYPIFPVRLMARLRYDARAALAEVRCPVLVVHSRSDEIVPVRHGRALHAAAGERAEFLEIDGSHNDGFLRSGERYAEGLAAFVAAVVPAPP